MILVPAAGASGYLLAAALIAGVGSGLDAAGVRPLGKMTWAAGVALLVLFAWFFRDPDRAVGSHVVSPADGRVVEVRPEGRGLRISVFLAPWDVHVGRAPLDGRVVRSEYRRGGHKPAFSKASASNERLTLTLGTAHGDARLALVAGTVARRIHAYVSAGDEVSKGDRVGVIAFGSRCELVLPPGFVAAVKPGSLVRAGVTTVATEAAP